MNPARLDFAEPSRAEPVPLPAGDPSPGTAPPPEATGSWLAKAKGRLSRTASGLLMPVIRRVAREHVGGETLDDAMTVADHLAQQGLPNTLGFWDTPDYTRVQVGAIYHEAIARAGARPDGCYVSVKPPALGFDPDLTAELAAAAHARRVKLHFDSHGIDVADRSEALLDAILARTPGCALGTTLPGRWARSVADAERAIARGLSVRVVKGQWPDPADPERDLRQGFLEVIEALAGRARQVAVASHDLPLVQQAVARLRAAGTPHEIEVIHGVPKADVLAWAEQNGVPVRIYIAFGKGFIPNAVRILRRNPRLAWRIVRAVALWPASGGRRQPARAPGHAS